MYFRETYNFVNFQWGRARVCVCVGGGGVRTPQAPQWIRQFPPLDPRMIYILRESSFWCIWGLTYNTMFQSQKNKVCV